MKRWHEPNKIDYVEFQGTVDAVDNILETCNGRVKYKAFVWWRYSLKDIKVTSGHIPEYFFINNTKFFAHLSICKKEAPSIGDRVTLRMRNTRMLQSNGSGWAVIIRVERKHD